MGGVRGFGKPNRVRPHDAPEGRVDIVDTSSQPSCMTKDHQYPEKTRPAGRWAIAEQAGTGKGSINLRIDGQTRALIDEAASSLGRSRTEFMIDTARRRAGDAHRAMWQHGWAHEQALHRRAARSDP